MDDYDDRRNAAIERLESRRELNVHALIFLTVNILLVIIWAATGAGYFWPVWVIGGWGIGLVSHAMGTYGQRPIDEQDIREEMQRHAS